MQVQRKYTKPGWSVGCEGGMRGKVRVSFVSRARSLNSSPGPQESQGRIRAGGEQAQRLALKDWVWLGGESPEASHADLASLQVGWLRVPGLPRAPVRVRTGRVPPLERVGRQPAATAVRAPHPRPEVAQERRVPQQLKGAQAPGAQARPGGQQRQEEAAPGPGRGPAGPPFPRICSIKPGAGPPPAMLLRVTA